MASSRLKFTFLYSKGSMTTYVFVKPVVTNRNKCRYHTGVQIIKNDYFQ